MIFTLFTFYIAVKMFNTVVDLFQFVKIILCTHHSSLVQFKVRQCTRYWDVYLKKKQFIEDDVEDVETGSRKYILKVYKEMGNKRVVNRTEASETLFIVGYTQQKEMRNVEVAAEVLSGSFNLGRLKIRRKCHSWSHLQRSSIACWPLGDDTDRLSRNVGDLLPFYDA